MPVDLFEAIEHVHSITSVNLHDNPYYSWDSENISLMLETIDALLTEIYVIPKKRMERSQKIAALKGDVKGAQKQAKEKE